MKKKNLKMIAAALAMISVLTITAAGCGQMQTAKLPLRQKTKLPSQKLFSMEMEMSLPMQRALP